MNEIIPGGLEWNGMDNCYKKTPFTNLPFQAMTIIFCSGYDNSEMMSLEEEISHLHKENSHVIIMIMIMIYS